MKRTRYEYLEHTADLGFRAYGATVEELFVNAAKALFGVMVSLDTVEEELDRALEVEADDIEALMVNWLGELLYLFDTQGLLPRRFHIENLTDCRLTATMTGEIMDPLRHEIKTGIKAVTYHQLFVRRRNGLWETQVFLDL